MPELPEVETTCRGLRARLKGLTITGATARVPKLRTPVPPQLHQATAQQKVVNIHRRSKYALIDLTNHQTILIHLGMSGRLTFQPANSPLEKHDHIIFDLSNGEQLRFNDPRRFGLIDVLPTSELEVSKYYSTLGPEPLSDTFTPDILYTALKNKSSPVKVALMNSKVVVGVGDIYASESLFRAGIRPARAAKRITKSEAQSLHGHIQDVLREAIKAGGSTLKDFKQADGSLGYFFYDFNVYGRDGAPCHTCKTPIKKIVLAQRSTFYCPNCQA